MFLGCAAKEREERLTKQWRRPKEKTLNSHEAERGRRDWIGGGGQATFGGIIFESLKIYHFWIFLELLSCKMVLYIYRDTIWRQEVDEAWKTLCSLQYEWLTRGTLRRVVALDSAVETAQCQGYNSEIHEVYETWPQMKIHCAHHVWTRKCTFRPIAFAFLPCQED